MSTKPNDKQDKEIEEQTEFTPEEAKEYGAFSEDAISEEDAIESSK
jgi:hypothetical protein